MSDVTLCYTRQWAQFGPLGAVSKPPDWSHGPAGKGDRRQRPPALPHQKRRQATAAPAADGIYFRPPPCPARKGDRRQRLPRPMSPTFTINTFWGVQFTSLFTSLNRPGGFLARIALAPWVQSQEGHLSTYLACPIQEGARKPPTWTSE